MEEHKTIIKFLSKTFILFIGWIFLYDIWLSELDPWLALRLAEASTLLLRVLGYAALSKDSIVSVDSQQLVYIGPECNGMVLMAIFAGFIIAYPGSILKKAFYIPFGLLVINFLNIIRVAALALNALYSSSTLEFNHKYTFTVIVYVFILVLWILWVKRFSRQETHDNLTISSERPAA